MTQLLLTALLAMFPHLRHASCVHARAATIAAEVEHAERAYGVPPAVMLVVGLYESHWGCAPGSGGCWGAPVSRARRNVAGTPGHAARALARSFAVCGSWRGAVARFRSGLCTARQPTHRQYVRSVAALVARIDPSVALDRAVALSPKVN